GGRGARAGGAHEPGADHAPAPFLDGRAVLRGLAQIHGRGVLQPVRGVAGQARVADRHRIVDGPVTVVVHLVARHLERARVDQRGVGAAQARGVAAVALAVGPPVAVGVGLVVHHAVAIVIDIVGAYLGPRYHLALARAPGALGVAGAGASATAAPALGARIAGVARPAGSGL